MIVKCTAIFQLATNISSPTRPDRRVGGWSESVYDDVGSFGVATINAFNKLCRLRAALLPTGSYIKGQRYQFVTPAGQSQTRDVPFPGPVGVPTDVPQMALLCSCPGKNVINRRNMILRGLPDAQVVEGEYVGINNYSQLVSAYFEQLSEFNFRGVDLAQQAFPLLTIAADGRLTFEDTTTLVAGEMVKVLRTLDSDDRKKGGVFKTIGLENPVGLGLINWPHGLTKGGKVRKNLIIWPAFDGARCQISQAIVRKVGKTSGQYRGRRSAKRA